MTVEVTYRAQKTDILYSQASIAEGTIRDSHEETLGRAHTGTLRKLFPDFVYLYSQNLIVCKSLCCYEFNMFLFHPGHMMQHSVAVLQDGKFRISNVTDVSKSQNPDMSRPIQTCRGRQVLEVSFPISFVSSTHIRSFLYQQESCFYYICFD